MPGLAKRAKARLNRVNAPGCKPRPVKQNRPDNIWTISIITDNTRGEEGKKMTDAEKLITFHGNVFVHNKIGGKGHVNISFAKGRAAGVVAQFKNAGGHNN